MLPGNMRTYRGSRLYSTAHPTDSIRGYRNGRFRLRFTHTRRFASSATSTSPRAISVQPIFAQSAHGTKPHRCRRQGVPRLRRRHRRAEPGAHARRGGRGDQGPRPTRCSTPASPSRATSPYIDVCQLLVENTPGNHEKKALLVNSGAEAVENAVKIARYATGRDAVITFDRGFHGRTLLTMTLTSKLVYKRGMGPYAPEVYRAPAPYPYRDITTEDALRRPRLDVQGDGRSEVGRVHDPRAGAGRGRLPRDAARVSARPQGAVRGARHRLHR